MFRDRLRFDNHPVTLGRSYQLRATADGLLNIEIDVNPFAGLSAERMSELNWELGQKTHLAREQGNYTLGAENILGTEGESKEWYLLLTLRFSDKIHQEIVWPSRVSGL